MASPVEVTAACAAVRKQIDQALPGWEASMVSDDMIKNMVVAALGAAEHARTAAVPPRPAG